MNSHKAFRCALSLLLSLVFIITLFPAAFAESGGQPLALRFVCDEAVATVTVYDLYGEAIPVQGDGIHHLAPGTYFYTAEAQGFESQVMQPFMIPADAVGDQEVRLTLTPLSVTAGQDPLPAEGGEQPYAPSRPDNTVSGGIFSARYGKYQVFDVQRDPAYPSGTQQAPEAFSVSALSVPFDLGEVAEDGFFYFIYLGTASQAGVSYSQHWNCGGEGLDPLAVSLHYKEGENDVFLASGIIGAFSAEGFLFASDGRGTWFSNTRGYRYADTVISYTPVENGRVVCDAGLLTSCYVENMQEPAEDAPTHLHNWQTASEKNRATFRCTAENCPYGTDTEYAMILTVAAEEGGPASANVTRRSPDGNWPAELGQDVIRFKGRGETEFAESTAAPSQDGLYTASVSVGYRLDPRILTLDFTVGMIGEETEETEETEPACPHAHTDVRLEVVTAPTCTEEGVYRKITFCTDCEEVLLTEPGTDPSLGHIWSEWEVISEPTPWAEGRKVRSCTREGCEEAEQTTLAALTPFFRSVTADNVVVTVRAPEGVFPADAVLYVQSVPEELRERADAAVAALREEDAEVTSSFTFDVRVLDADGNELRPPEGKEGSVSFSFAEVRGEDAEACIYCLTEQEGALTAEKTDAKTAGDSVTATVSGFSLCHVETTRKVLASTLSGFALRSGSPTDLIVVSSLDDLVRTLNHQSSTDEHAPTVIQLGDTISGEVILEIESGTFVTLDLNGHTLNLGSTNLVIYGSLTLRDSVGGGTLSCYSVVCEGEGSFTMLGGTVDATDVTMNGSFTMLGGTVDTTFVNVNGGSFTMSGGTVTEVDVYPGGSFTMSGGTVTSVEVYSGSSFTMSGGTVSNPEGYGIIVYGGTVNLSGDPAITGKVAGIYFTYLAPTINITGPLRNADKISIGMFAPGVFTAGYGTHNTADPSTVFTSAAEGYEVVKNADGEAELRQRVVTYPLWVGGVQVTSANASAVTGDGISGTVKYEGDASKGTLTLSGAKITGSYTFEDDTANIYTDAINLTINLVGNNNSLSGAEYGVRISGNLTVTGGTLSVGDDNTWHGINAGGSFTVNKCTDLRVSGQTHGIIANDITITGSSVTANSSSIGICCVHGNIEISGNSTVHATGGGGAVCAQNGTITIGSGLGITAPQGGKVGKPGNNTYVLKNDNTKATEVTIEPAWTVSVSADPAAGGTATITSSSATDGKVSTQWAFKKDGSETATLTATANSGYAFKNWTENGSVIEGAGATYTFSVTKDRNLTANFEQIVTYPLWVGGVQVTSANASAVTGDGISGTVSYDRATKTLTLENATITGKSFIPPSNIYSDGEDLKIKLVGTNTLSVDKNGVGITIRNAGLTITGDSLCVGDSTRSSDSGICAATNITIENCGNLEVFAATLGLYSENNLSGHGGSITIADSKVTVKGEVCGGREITVTGNSTVHAVHRGGEGAVCVRNKKGTINIGAGLSVITPVGGVIGKPDGWKYIYDGDEIAKEVLIAPGYTVSVNADPAAGGTVSGGGAYSRTGATATLTATPAAGGWYRFKNWTENGSVAGTENPYSFPVTGDRTLTANFEFGVEIYAAGNGDGNWLNGAAWDTGYASNKLTETAPGIYQITFENVGEGFGRQVKFAVDKVWTKNFGSDGQFTVGECCNAVPNGDNITFDTDGLCDVTLTLDLTQFDPETGKGATYKVEIGGRHTHSFAYTANGAQVTAKCVGSGDCPEGYQSNGITLTLNAPAELTYDGTAKAATLSGYPATPPANLAAAPTGISYYKSAGAGSTTPSGGALSGAPADAGDYVAQFTWGDETASLAFTVAKREVTVKAEDAADVTYNGSKQVGNTAVTFSNVVSGHTATITYTPAEGTLASVTPYSGSYGTDFAVMDRGGLDVTANYDLKTQTPGKLTITPSTKALVIASPSNSWEYDDDVHTDEAYTVTYDGQAVQPDDTGKVFTLPTGDTVTVTPTASGVKNVSDTAENNNTYTYVLTNEGCYSSVTANTGTLSITPKQLSDGMLTFDSVVTAPADGKAHGPAITLADGTAALEAGKDYTLSGETQSAVFGEHSFTVAGTGNYTGELKDNTWTLKGDAGGTLTYGVQEEAGAPVTVTWVNQSADLARSLLTDGERTSLDLYDTPTAVFVKIAPPDDPSGEDARKLEALAKKRGEKIGVTMEITLWVYSGNEKPRQITDTGGKPITLKIEIPAGLRNAPDGYSRSFSLLTVHNGEAKVVASGSGSSFTQSLTEFSPYAVSYWDTELPRGASPRTGDNNNLALWLALAAVSAAGCAALAVTGKKRKRK